MYFETQHDRRFDNKFIKQFSNLGEICFEFNSISFGQSKLKQHLFVHFNECRLFFLLSMQEIVTIAGVITLVVYFSVASLSFGSFSVISKSVVTQNLVILLTSLWSGV